MQVCFCLRTAFPFELLVPIYLNYKAKSFTHAELKMRYDHTFIFPHPGQLQGPSHIIDDLSMLQFQTQPFWENTLF